MIQWSLSSQGPLNRKKVFFLMKCFKYCLCKSEWTPLLAKDICLPFKILNLRGLYKMAALFYSDGQVNWRLTTGACMDNKDWRIKIIMSDLYGKCMGQMLKACEKLTVDWLVGIF